MSSSFNSPWQIGSVEIKNRLVRSATNLRLAGPDGDVTDQLAASYARLAEGGVGLLITGHAFVSPEGRAQHGQLGVYHEALRPGLTRLAEAAHARGVKVLLQISHGGTRSLPLCGERMGPSGEDGALEMTRDDIERVSACFVSAASLAEKAGFDGVQIQAAHRYLLSEFLSPLSNRRGDQYGRKEGGTRVVRRIIEDIRKAVRKESLVTAKIGADTRPSGNDRRDVLWIVKELLSAGLDCVEISRGYAQTDETVARKIKAHVNEAYNLDVALYIKQRVPFLPVIVVGGFRSIEAVESALSQGIDAVALSRPLIAEPDLPARWIAGDRTPSLCVSCSRCIRGKGSVSCACVKPVDDTPSSGGA
jgi:2,4-dienoyl-CoA reductase-like NADH-dependent reductase (Old Yellow Enzyme family)